MDACISGTEADTELRFFLLEREKIGLSDKLLFVALRCVFVFLKIRQIGIAENTGFLKIKNCYV
ncbi:MAG: hypothetical protein GY820_01250 [Gammaproteobacteria bacterium]|nr:hypothetical protein [Gammaproteobacteria bacterium]